jgi:hypothetical protein
MSFISKNIYDTSNNFDVKSYFEDIFLEIKKAFNLNNKKSD